MVIATSGISAAGVVSPQGFADALSTTPLTDLLDAPVLLNNEGDTLDPRNRAFLRDAGFERAVVIGGDALFSERFVAELGEVVGGNTDAVERIYGANRYETSVQVAARTFAEADEASYREGNVFLASGTDFADALAAGAAAAENDGVVLLTHGDDRVYDSVYDFAVTTIGNAEGNDLNHGAIYAIGGPAASAAAAGNPHGEVLEVDHELVGEYRYETATLVAGTLFDDPESIVVTSGLAYTDAVVGGAYAANADGPLLLTRHASLDPFIEAYLLEHRSDVENVFVFGGPGVVEPAVSTQIAGLAWDY